MSWLRYEKIDEGLNNFKFWAIGPVKEAAQDNVYSTLDRKFYFSTKWGRIGSNGQDKSYFYTSRITAREEREVKINAKKGEGYKLVVPGVSIAGVEELPRLGEKPKDVKVEDVLTERSIILGGE